MMYRATLLLMTFVVAAMVNMAQAEERQPFTLSFGEGEDAVTVEGALNLTDSVTLRVPMGVAQAPRDFSGEPGISVGGLGVVADYTPGPAGLRLSGGAIIGGGSGTLSDGVVIDGTLLSLGEVQSDDTTVNPVVSLGYERSFESGWALSGDLGAVFSEGSGSGSALDVPSGEFGVTPYVRFGLTLEF